jgi:hypothetical protein
MSQRPSRDAFTGPADEETLALTARVLETPFASRQAEPGLLLSLQEQLQTDADSLYQTKHIPKEHGATRRIDKPAKVLKFVQRRIADLLGHAWVAPGVCGFSKDTSAQKGLRWMIDQAYGAEKTKGKGPIVAVHQEDITDFFPSVKSTQVFDALRQHFLHRILHKWEKGPQVPQREVDKVAALLTDISCYEGRLPQGSPASPILSNIVGTRFDFALIKMLGEDAVYGRYADDMVILGMKELDPGSRGNIRNVLNNNGFRVNRDKGSYRTFGEGDREEIWGMHLIKDKDKAWFRLPRRMEREWSEDLMRLIEEAPNTKKKFNSKEEGGDVRRALGRLAYAFQVTRWGHPDRQKGRTYPETSATLPVTHGSKLFLPHDLGSAWKAFHHAHHDHLPDGHDDWFQDSGPVYRSVQTERPVTQAEFEEAVRAFCTTMGYDSGTQHQIQAEQTRLRTRYDRNDGDPKRPQQCDKDGDYPDMELEEAAGQFLKNCPGFADTAQARGAFAPVFVLHAAFVRELFAGGMLGFSWNPEQTSLLPACAIDNWKKIAKEHAKLGVGKDELLDVFRREEFTTEYHLHRQPDTHERHKEHLHLYGFEDEA